mmetsp:Transcript_2121/g.7549  ORF Transcript_2121/g.7549 Transcript_2121/m.7549 type:complete len:251 (+) Transcript_2121:161-913(+)
MLQQGAAKRHTTPTFRIDGGRASRPGSPCSLPSLRGFRSPAAAGGRGPSAVGTTTPRSSAVPASLFAASAAASSRAASRKSRLTRVWKDLRPSGPSLKATCEPDLVMRRRAPGCSRTITSGRASDAGHTKSSSALSTSTGTLTFRRTAIGSCAAKYSSPVAPRRRIAKGACAASRSDNDCAARQASTAAESYARSSRSFRRTNRLRIWASIARSAAGCASLIAPKALPTSHAGQIAHAAPTGVAEPAAPR